MTRWGAHTARRFASPTAFNLGHSACGGFSLVELVLVLVIVGIFAGMAVPRYANLVARQRADAAARRIKTDLALARRQARFSSTSQTIDFDVNCDSYGIAEMQDPDHPGSPYVVSLLHEPYRATIVSADFGGNTKLIFDGYGAPDSSGTVVIQAGNYQRTITVDAGM